MPRRSSLPSQILALCISTSSILGYQWPSPQYDALEGFLYEGRRFDGSNMASIQHPCKKRSGTQASIGAEWLRLAYHDTATHNAAEGTGGLDGSIAFELDRSENIGSGMNASLQDFVSFSSKYVSRSDVIAAATVFAVASCGGPLIPFRGGRIDALSAGSMGVPEPQQDLATHTEIFRRQGFTQEEMITLVACGHTLGGVRSNDFPAIVRPSDDSTTPNFEVFDTTSVFDNTVVLHYLDGTTSNPLVVEVNQTLRSDLRIFSSDNNRTMQSLASPDAFASSCQDMLERMLNMVPKGVTLTEEITLLHAKVSNAQLTLEKEVLVFKVSLRLTQAINTTVSDNRTVKLLWCDRRGSNRECLGHTNTALPAAQNQDEPQISPVTSRLGYYFVNYQFAVPIDSSASISMFWFEVDEHDGTTASIHDNEGTGYKIAQDNVLYAPTLSSATFQRGEDSVKTYHIVAAIRNGATPSHVYLNAFDSAMPGYAAPLNTSVNLKLNNTITPIQGYSFYSGVVQDLGLQLTVDLQSVVDGVTYMEDYLQTFFLNTDIPFTPSTTVQTTIAAMPGTTSNIATIPSSSSGTIPDRAMDFWTLAMYLVIFTISMGTMLSCSLPSL
ncbi:heme peroxidase [Crucibulum laeve]|uniref:Peroxidase n=1 Tax=Crucibulum laeve TaxID=68775 RepID=A0A5C3MDA7_9AGAR|nr:heme peroxidase [Crucibulum laeve]